jgi:hypothetical protein
MKAMINYSFDPRKTLWELIQAMELDPMKINVVELQGVANRLSQMSRKSPAWSWRYLRMVLNGKMVPSGRLVEAMMRLGAVLDGTPEELARSERVTVVVRALGKVGDGALVLADSRVCANPGCGVVFVPRTPNQACHSAECAKMYRKVKRHREENSTGMKRIKTDKEREEGERRMR